MSYFFSWLTLLLIGMTILMLGILMTRKQGQSFQSVLNSSMAWGMLYLFCFGAEFLILANA
jgi:hypothetical protein